MTARLIDAIKYYKTEIDLLKARRHFRAADRLQLLIDAVDGKARRILYAEIAALILIIVCMLVLLARPACADNGQTTSGTVTAEVYGGTDGPDPEKVCDRQGNTYYCTQL